MKIKLPQELVFWKDDYKSKIPDFQEKLEDFHP